MGFRAMTVKASICSVMRPASTAEVSEVIKLANRHKIPVVPWGGGSGIDTIYRDDLLRFKKGLTHCAISLMRIREV